eukprot:NODE_50_length_31184_cov_0.705099.p13 type:complete len:300 gc:universal NODE_50_length_31184_cov_0.705099:7085-6186(-)
MKSESFFRFKPCNCCEGICAKYDKFEYEIVDKLICKTFLQISTLKEYKKGNLYGIDYSSCIVVKSLLSNVMENEKLCILELCCAPGAKILYMCDLLPNCKIVGMDIRKDRLGVAKMLLRKYNHLDKVQLLVGDAQTNEISRPCIYQEGTKYNRKLTLHSPKLFNRSAETTFDRVLIDAECSINGKTRHIPKGIGRSTYDNLFRLQINLLKNGFRHTIKNGIVAYSTCSLSVHENECVVSEVLKSFPNAELEIPSFWGDLNLKPTEKYCDICNASYKIGVRIENSNLGYNGMFVVVLKNI